MIKFICNRFHILYRQGRNIMTINEIAKLARVSRATVSRYLNNGYVSEEKRKIIQEVIRQTGYQPSKTAQNLRNKTTRYIGVIIPKINSDSISRIVYGIGEVLTAEGYQLLLGNTNNKEHEELKYLDLFKENYVDGIILIGTIFTPEHKKILRSLTVPIVIAAQHLSGYSCVYSDDYHAAYDITEVLAEQGKFFGYLGATMKDKAVGYNRREGFLAALSSHSLSISEDCMAESAFTIESGYEKAKELITHNPKIDSLFCATDTIAVGALQYLRENGCIIPAQIQVASIGDSSNSNVCCPPLTTVHLHYKTTGMEAAKMLIEQLKNRDSAVNKEIKLGYQIIRRGSTR